MQGNSKVVIKQTFYAFLIKGLSLIISFFSTPIFIRYFNNNEVLGLWFTLLSVLIWVLTFDFGIGNGIRNHLVKAIVHNDRRGIRKILSSGLVSISCVTILLGTVVSLLIVHSDLNEFFNVSPSLISPQILRISSLLVFASIMLRFLLTTVSSIYYALQRSAVNNFLSLLVNLLLFLYTILFRYDNVETALLNISVAYLIICNVPLIIAGIWVFFADFRDCVPHYSFINIETIKNIMGIGTIFFLCQIFYLIITNTNEFFISHFWSPTYTADYGFYYRITMLLSMLVSLGLTPTWSMITKAYEDGNYTWLTKLYRSFKLAGVFIMVIQFAMIPFLQFIMNIWLGKGELNVELNVAFAFACFGASFIYSSMLSTIVCGLARMKLQTWCYGFGAAIKIFFIIIISRISENWTWVVWSNVFILLPYCILQQINLDRLFLRLKYER